MQLVKIIVFFVGLSICTCACKDSIESPYVAADAFFNAGARQDSAGFKSTLDAEGQRSWQNVSSKERLTFQVLGGIDFKVEPLRKSESEDSATVAVMLSILNVRDQRLMQTVHAGTVDTLIIHLRREADSWQVANISS